MPFRDLAVNRKRICRRAEAPCDIVRERAGCRLVSPTRIGMVVVIAATLLPAAHLIAGRQITVHGLAAAKLQRESPSVPSASVLRRGGHHVGHVARRTVRKRRRHDHAGFVKGLTGCVLSSYLGIVVTSIFSMLLPNAIR